MSHDHAIDLTALSASVAEKVRKPLPGWMRPLFLGSAVIGALTFLILAIKVDPDRAWRVYHLNWLYWTGLAQGSATLGRRCPSTSERGCRRAR